MWRINLFLVLFFSIFFQSYSLVFASSIAPSVIVNKSVYGGEPIEKKFRLIRDNINTERTYEIDFKDVKNIKIISSQDHLFFKKGEKQKFFNLTFIPKKGFKEEKFSIYLTPKTSEKEKEKSGYKIFIRHGVAVHFKESKEERKVSLSGNALVNNNGLYLDMKIQNVGNVAVNNGILQYFVYHKNNSLITKGSILINSKIKLDETISIKKNIILNLIQQKELIGSKIVFFDKKHNKLKVDTNSNVFYVINNNLNFDHSMSMQLKLLSVIKNDIYRRISNVFNVYLFI